MTELNIVALVSIGAHPASGRPRRAEQDARAVELGLRLSGPRLQVLHAGDPHAEALRGYLGMGLERLSVLEQPAGADALPALAEHLRDSRAQLVLTRWRWSTTRCSPKTACNRPGRDRSGSR